MVGGPLVSASVAVEVATGTGDVVARGLEVGMRVVWLLCSLLFVVTSGCRSAVSTGPVEDVPRTSASDRHKGEGPAPLTTTHPIAAARPGCRTDLLAHGGAFLQRPDGTQLWYDVEGPENAEAVLYLHGGPGYNAYAYKRAVGHLLKPYFRMVYVDQRGAGRSHQIGAAAKLGRDPTLEDFEAVRRKLGIQAWHLVGHSFGGVLAAQYKSRFPDAVKRMVLVDTAVDIEAALSHQVKTLAQRAPEKGWNAIRLDALTKDRRPAVDRLADAYNSIGRVEVQAALHFADRGHQTKMEKWDQESGIMACTRAEVVKAYREEKALGSRPFNTAVALDDAVLFVGAKSQVIGPKATDAATKVWGTEVVRFGQSGHFVYLEEPARFTAEVRGFLNDERPEPDCTMDHFALGPSLRGPDGNSVRWWREGRQIMESQRLASGWTVTRSRGGCVHIHDAFVFVSSGDKRCPASETAIAKLAAGLLEKVSETGEAGETHPPTVLDTLRKAITQKTVADDATFPCGDATCTVECSDGSGEATTVEVHYDFAL